MQVGLAEVIAANPWKATLEQRNGMSSGAAFQTIARDEVQVPRAGVCLILPP